MESGSLLSEALERMKEWRHVEEEDEKVLYHGYNSPRDKKNTTRKAGSDSIHVELYLISNDNNNEYWKEDVMNEILLEVYPQWHLWHIGGQAGMYFVSQSFSSSTSSSSTSSSSDVMECVVKYGPSCHVDEWMVVAIVDALCKRLQKRYSLSVAATFVDDGYSLLAMEASHVLPSILDNDEQQLYSIYWYQGAVYYGTSTTTTSISSWTCDDQMTNVIRQTLQPFQQLLVSTSSSSNNNNNNKSSSLLLSTMDWKPHTTAVVLPRPMAHFIQQRPDLIAPAILLSTKQKQSKRQTSKVNWNLDLVVTRMTLPKTTFALMASTSSHTTHRRRNNNNKNNNNNNQHGNVGDGIEWKRMKRTLQSYPHLQQATSYGLLLCQGYRYILTYPPPPPTPVTTSTSNSKNNNNSIGLCPLTHPHQSIRQQLQSFLSNYNKNHDNNNNNNHHNTFPLPTMNQVDSQDWMILPNDDTAATKDDHDDGHTHSALEQYMMDIVSKQQQQKQKSNQYYPSTTSLQAKQSKQIMDQLYQDVESFIIDNNNNSNNNNNNKPNHQDNYDSSTVNINSSVVLHMLRSIYDPPKEENEQQQQQQQAEEVNDDDLLEQFFTKSDLDMMEQELNEQLKIHDNDDDDNDNNNSNIKDYDRIDSNSNSTTTSAHLLSNWLQSLEAQGSQQPIGPVSNMLHQFVSQRTSTTPK